MVHTISRWAFINFSRACTFLTLFCICILFYRLVNFLGLRTSVYHTDFCSGFKPFSLVREEIFFVFSSSFTISLKVPTKLRILLHLMGKHRPADWSYCGHYLIFACTYNEIAVRFKTVTQNSTCAQEIWSTKEINFI